MADSQSIKLNEAIIEIRAGAGGEEAALFVADLYRMYSRYAMMQGWKQDILDSKPSELGGYKEMVLELQGNGAFSKMQNEGGVHRVQRIPKTEKQGRVHTSTVSVAVLPKPQETHIKMNPADVRLEVCKATGPGGQNVNKRMTAVRLIHLPTGMVVECHTERNLQQNKESAMGLLAAKLLEKQEMAQIGALDEKRRIQIGWAKRAEKVRTYNFPQDRLTDHRVKKSFHNLEGIMDGKLDKVIQTMQESL
ncbi:MAG: PCRF domain-containing protein [Candidatus Nealsonbacteria bacterium]